MQLPGSFDEYGLPYCGHVVAYDAASNLILINGGIYPYGFDPDVTGLWFIYSVSTNAWTNLLYSGSAGRHGHSVIHTSQADEVVTFGGTRMYGFDSKRNDTWSLRLSQTPSDINLPTVGELPTPRAGHCAVYDSNRDRMIIWAGYGGFLYEVDPVPNEVWALSFSDSSWSRLDVGGVLPSSRYHHAAVYDPARDQMIVVGGRAFTGSADTVLALKFNPERWERLDVKGSPPSLDLLDFGVTNSYPRHSAFMDISRDRILVYDSHISIWVLDLGVSELTWREVTTSGGGPIGYFSADYDELTETLYAHGAEDQIWTFTFERPVPVQFLDFKAAWEGNSAHVQWIVADQISNAGFDVYREDAEKELQKLTQSPLLGETSYQFIDSRAPAVGASYWIAELGREGLIQWHGPAVLPPYSEVKPTRLGLSPNPLQGTSVIHFELSHPGRVRATVYDLLGRHIDTPIDAEYAAGAHDVPLSPDAGPDKGLKPGIYILRLTTAEGSASIKVSKVR